jgi:hypothetical protein
VGLGGMGLYLAGMSVQKAMYESSWGWLVMGVLELIIGSATIGYGIAI